MSSGKHSILLTGATGYIGGSILDYLLKSDHPALKDVVITCLVRGHARVAKLNTEYGGRVNPVLYRDVDDIERTVEIGSQHDIIINTTIGDHPASAAALVHGLAKRKQQTGKDVFIIHTSGTSNLGDYPITKAYVESDPERVFDDSKDDIYSYEKMRNEKQAYGQRTSELGLIDAGLEEGVKTLVIMSPTIYGVGTGKFNKSSIQIRAYVKAMLALGQALVIGQGEGVWNYVHVEDLAELYTLCLLSAMENGGKDFPWGKEGIIFSGNGSFKWFEVAQGVANAAHAAGKIQTNEVKSVSLEEGANALAGGDKLPAEVAFCSNARTRSTVARNVGWKPTRGPETWQRGFEEEVQAALK